MAKIFHLLCLFFGLVASSAIQGSYECSEQGLRSAIQAGGLALMKCSEKTVVSLSSAINFEKDVTINGHGKLVIKSSNGDSLFGTSAQNIKVEFQGVALLAENVDRSVFSFSKAEVEVSFVDCRIVSGSRPLYISSGNKRSVEECTLNYNHDFSDLDENVENSLETSSGNQRTQYVYSDDYNTYAVLEGYADANEECPTWYYSGEVYYDLDVVAGESGVGRSHDNYNFAFLSGINSWMNRTYMAEAFTSYYLQFSVFDASADYYYSDDDDTNTFNVIVSYGEIFTNTYGPFKVRGNETGTEYQVEFFTGASAEVDVRIEALGISDWTYTMKGDAVEIVVPGSEIGFTDIFLQTVSMTTQPLTSQEMTTQPLTTQEMTTQPLTTQELTTMPLTTQEMTTMPLTTQEVTTTPNFGVGPAPNDDNK